MKLTFEGSLAEFAEFSKRFSHGGIETETAPETVSAFVEQPRAAPKQSRAPKQTARIKRTIEAMKPKAPQAVSPEAKLPERKRERRIKDAIVRFLESRKAPFPVSDIAKEIGFNPDAVAARISELARAGEVNRQKVDARRYHYFGRDVEISKTKKK